MPGLDALEHVEADNLLAVALSVLMRVAEERQAWLKARALQRVAEAALSAYRRFLLMELIEAYLPLDGPRLEEFERLLLTEDFHMVRVLGPTTFEKGIEKGEEQGVVKGQRALLLRQLEQKCGALSEAARARLESWSADRLLQLGDDLLTRSFLVELGLEDAPNGSPSSGT